MSSVLIFKELNKKQMFGDGLPPGSDVYMNRNSLCSNTGLLEKRSIEHLRHKDSGNIATELIADPIYWFRLLLK